MRFRVVEPLAVAADVTLGPQHQSAPGKAVTANLTTDYRRPVPVGDPLRTGGRQGRKLRTAGELHLADGTVAATGLFIVVPDAHFARNAPARVQA